MPKSAARGCRKAFHRTRSTRVGRCFRPVLAAATLFLAATSAPMATAATYTWAGGAGTWTTANAWSGQTWVNNNDALFIGTGGTVAQTLNGNATGITFDAAAGAYTLSLNNNFLIGSGGVTANQDGTIAQANYIFPIVASSTQTWTVASGKTLTMDFGGSTARVNNSAGTVLTKAGDGTLAIKAGFAGNSFQVYPGNTFRLTAGRVTIDQVTVPGMDNGGVFTISGGTMALGTGTSAGDLGGSGTYNLDGGVISNIRRFYSASGTATFNFNGGTLGSGTNYVGSDFFHTAANLNVKAGGIAFDTNGFSVDIYKPFTEDPASTGGGFRKLGAGTLQLTGSNTFTGNTRVSAGTLTLNGPFVIGRSTLDMNAADSGTVSFSQNQTMGGLTGSRNLDMGTRTLSIGNNNSSTTYSGTLSNGVLTKVGTGVLALSAANTYTGVTTVTAGVLAVDSIGNGGSNSGIGASGSAATNLVFGSPTATLRYTGGTNASTNRSFTMSSGAGGGATIEASGAGTLSFDNTVALAYGTTNQTRVLTLGGTNAGNNTFAKVLANNGTGTTSLTKAGTGRWVLSGANTYSGATAVDAGVLALGANNTIPNGSAVTIGTGSSAGGLDLAGFADTVASLTLTSGSIFGSGTLTATTYALNGGTVAASLGAGTLTVATGTTTLNAAAAATTVNVPSGRLVLGGNDRLATGAAVTVSGGVLDMNGNTNSVNSFAISNGSLAGPGKLTSTTGYALSGGDVAANIGLGTVTVTGNAGLGGTTDATTVNLVSGTLTLGSAGRFTSSAVAVTGSTGAGLVLGGNETIGTLAGNANVALGSFRLTTGSGGNSSFAGGLSGSGGLTKVGSSVFTLAGANTYTGQTIISGGTLALASGGSFTNSSKIIVGDANSTGAVLDLAAKAGPSGSFTLAQGQTLMGKGTVNLGGGNLIAQGFLAPGNSPGNLGVTGNLVWTGTAAQGYQWEINNATGSAGTASGGWDVISVSGILDMSALSASNRYFLDLITLDPTTNLAGQMANYVDGSSYTWNLVNASSVLLATGTAAAGTDVTSLFNVSFTNWANPAPAPGNYSIRVADGGSGISLVIVPEPNSLAIAALGLGIVSWSRLRRRQT